MWRFRYHFSSFHCAKRKGIDKLFFGPVWDFDIAFDNDKTLNYVISGRNKEKKDILSFSLFLPDIKYYKIYKEEVDTAPVASLFSKNSFEN